ncbi:MAG: sulfur carrier protein ThiS [Armatimonadetes bacterium]|nr:sulfur carrier protein ThiS [Armatimonadota bacterium]
MIELTINGKPARIDEGATVASLLESRGINPKIVVVEHNFEILPREKYAETLLHQGDNLEIVTMTAGG